MPSDLLAAAAAPAVPAGLAAAGLIATAAAWLVLIAVLWAYRGSLKKLLLLIADELDKLNIPVINRKPFGPVSSRIRTVADAIDTALGKWALKAENGMTWLAGQVMWLIRMMGLEIAELADDTADAIAWVKHRAIPQAVSKATALPNSAIKKLRSQVATLDRELDKAFGKARKGIDAINKWRATTLPRTLRGIRGRIGTLERTVASPKWWSKNWARVLPASVAAGLFVTALGRLGLGWLRCSNTKRLGKQACGMHPLKLEELLLATTAILGTVSFIEFVEDMQDVEDIAIDAMRKFIREF